MRRGVFVFVFILVLIVVFLVQSVWTLLSLLIEDASNDAIQKSELPAPNSPLIETRPQVIPKIIHQTYINESIPEHWKPAQKSCLDLHEDYEYMLWTDKKSRELIEAEYPWFLDTFDNYKWPIQRADAIRYFVLAHYGGIYLDLDDGCNRRLDPLLSYNAWLRRTKPTGISNDAMGSVPRHPFFLRTIDSLQSYNKKWVLPYISIMASTGPLFLSMVWKEYMNDGPSEEDRVRILMPAEYNQHAWSFFKQYRGSSWHGKDAQLIFWMGSHWMFLTALGFMVAGLVGICLWWVYGRILLLGSHKRLHRPSSSPPKRTGFIPPLFRRSSSKPVHYELLDRSDDA